MDKEVKKVKSFYEKAVKDNLSVQADIFNLNDERNIKQEIDLILDYNPKSILEIGPGYGRLARVFNKKKIKYLGIEIYKKYVDLLKKQEINVIEGDFFEYNFGIEKFDVVCFPWTVLGHYSFAKQEEAIKKAKSLINDGGVVAVSLWMEDEWLLFNNIEDSVEKNENGIKIKLSSSITNEEIDYFLQTKKIIKKIGKQLNMDVEIIEKEMFDTDFSLRYAIFKNKK